jgi:hypothetical protein
VLPLAQLLQSCLCGQQEPRKHSSSSAGAGGRGCTRQRGSGGRVKILQQSISGSTISWNLIPNGMVALPVAGFADYSDIALYPPYPSTNDCPGLGGNGTGLYKVAITSQASSKLWIGTFNAKTWSFGSGTTYEFPKSGSQTIYCNVEGVTFLSSTRIAVVSDAANENQPECLDKDQSIHIFDIP